MQRTLKHSLRSVFLTAFTSIIATTGLAATMASSCSMSDDKLELVGKNIDKLMPIASVSKIYTSLMAATGFNLESKFYTQIYVAPVAADLFDVHIQGSHDPYFNNFKMHMIISKLNEMHVTKIQNLTFDENVKFLYDTDAKKGFRVGKLLIQPLILKAEMIFPKPEIVQAELRQMAQILKSYKQSYKLAATNGIELFNNPVLKVENISYLPSTEFKPTAPVQKIFVASQNLKTILKSMNWNSNNHAANQMFIASGGLSRFRKLYFQDFKQSESDVNFVNGSGQNHDLTDGGRLYNKATCRNVLRTLYILNKSVQAQKLQLQDIMSVVGLDKFSTVGGAAYSNPIMTGSVIAKSGTVGTNVALGGLAYTKNGQKYFMYNVELGYAPARTRNKKAWQTQEENRARRLISSELQKMIQANGGPVKFKYVSQSPLLDTLENYDEDAPTVSADLNLDEKVN